MGEFESGSVCVLKAIHFQNTVIPPNNDVRYSITAQVSAGSGMGGEEGGAEERGEGREG